MTTTELHKLSKQCGKYFVEFSEGKINGYLVTGYEGLNPSRLELVKTITRPDRVTSFDGAYDLLFGKPTAPDFTKVFNN